MPDLRRDELSLITGVALNCRTKGNDVAYLFENAEEIERSN